MSDTAYPVLQHYGTNAQRLAFTPAPAAGTQPLYIWYETDTDNYYIYTTAWKGPYSTGGGGTVTTTGSPASGNLTKFSGATSVTNGDLSGDVTTSGTLATTIANNAVTTAKINTSAVTLAKIQNAAANSTLLGSGAAGSGSAYSELTLGTNLSMSGTTLNATGGSGGLVLLEQHTASNSTSLDFTSFISSSYDTYMIIGTGIVPATSTANLLLEVGTGAGPSWDTGANYEWASLGIRVDTGGVVGDTGFSSTPARLFNSMGSTAGWSGTFNLTATQLQSTSLRKTFIGTNQFINAVPLALYSVIGAQWVTTGTAATGLRFIMSSGNIASGTIRIYGLAQ